MLKMFGKLQTSVKEKREGKAKEKKIKKNCKLQIIIKDMFFFVKLLNIYFVHEN